MNSLIFPPLLPFWGPIKRSIIKQQTYFLPQKTFRFTKWLRNVYMALTKKIDKTYQVLFSLSKVFTLTLGKNE